MSNEHLLVLGLVAAALWAYRSRLAPRPPAAAAPPAPGPIVARVVEPIPPPPTLDALAIAHQFQAAIEEKSRTLALGRFTDGLIEAGAKSFTPAFAPANPPAPPASGPAVPNP